jgi:hypothetical protein
MKSPAVNEGKFDLNPFSSRFVSPLTCQFVGDQKLRGEIEFLVDAIAQKGCAQIVGPHGTGKTTLAVQSANKLSDRFRSGRIITIRRSQAVWPVEISVTSQILFENESDSWGPKLVVLDGLEQLSLLHQCYLLRSFRQRKVSLIVTSHRPVWLIRDRITLEPSAEQFQSIARMLVSQTGFKLEDEVINSVYFRCLGNYRDGLSLLYDHLFESNKRQDVTFKHSAATQVNA